MDERLKQLADQNPEVREMLEKAALRELVRTIRLARIRCIEPEQLIARIPNIWDDPDRSEILSRLLELELNEDQLAQLAESVRVLAHIGDHLPSRERSRVENSLARIIRILPMTLANELVEPLLEHPSSSRRAMAYRALRHTGVTAHLARRLIEIFTRTKDERLLELIVRSRNIVPRVDVRFLLENLSEDYWRTRVMEALFRHKPPRAVEFAETYPKEFIWALGRAKAGNYLKVAWRLLDHERTNIEFLSLFAWALGKLGAGKDLSKLEKHIKNTFEQCE